MIYVIVMFVVWMVIPMPVSSFFNLQILSLFDTTFSTIIIAESKTVLKNIFIKNK